MLTSTEPPCGVKINNCSYVLDLLTRGPLYLSKGWTSGWSRPSHLLMSRPINLPLWLSCPTRPGVWRPPRPWYQELLSKRFVMRQAGPPHIHQILFFRPGLYPRFPGALVLVLLAWFHTGQALVTMVMLYWRSQSVYYATEFPWKGTFGYYCNLGSLKREQTLHPRPYLLCACKRLAQTFNLVTVSFRQAL